MIFLKLSAGRHGRSRTRENRDGVLLGRFNFLGVLWIDENLDDLGLFVYLELVMRLVSCDP